MNIDMAKARAAVGRQVYRAVDAFLEALPDAVRPSFEFLQRRRQSYALTFDMNSAHARAVLKDLAQFCRAGSSNFYADGRVHALMEGRREVYLRIAHHLNLTEQQLWALYGEQQ